MPACAASFRGCARIWIQWPGHYVSLLRSLPPSSYCPIVSLRPSVAAAWNHLSVFPRSTVRHSRCTSPMMNLSVSLGNALNASQSALSVLRTSTCPGQHGASFSSCRHDDCFFQPFLSEKMCIKQRYHSWFKFFFFKKQSSIRYLFKLRLCIAGWKVSLEKLFNAQILVTLV